jgi:hypothetical protein
MADDPWLVVGRRGRARAAEQTRHSSRHKVSLDAEEKGAARPPPPARARAAVGPTTPSSPPAAALVAAVTAAEASVLASGWWTGLVRAMQAASQAAEAAGGGGGDGGGGASPSPFPWHRVGGLALLGLGSLEAAAPGPRSQAALAGLFARHLASLGVGGAGEPPTRRVRLVAADPAFGPADDAALAALGFEVLSPGAVLGALAVGATPATPWVAYLPHCPSSVAEGVLGAVGAGPGEGSTAAPALALLGNSLDEVSDRWACALPNGRGGRRGAASTAADPHGCGRPARALGLVEAGRVVEVRLAPVGREGDKRNAAFASTALHLFLPPAHPPTSEAVEARGRGAVASETQA